MKYVQLNNWSVVHNPNASPYDPPEVLTQHLAGEVYGHPRIADYKRVVTSEIVGVTEDNLVTTKSGSKYKLLMVDPIYEEKFPDAYTRLLKSLRERR